ncbi:MAG: polysaccharide pyruvyl transferase family protein [Rikenellaceae bacterium]
MIKINWGRSLNNFGDCLQPYIVKHYGLTPVFCSWGKSDLIIVGSILQWIPPSFHGYIVGAGGDDIKYSFPNAKVLAVRGKLTKSNFDNNSQIILGDPGILMPLVFSEKVDVKYEIGIIPHFVDEDSVKMREIKSRFVGENVLFINVLRNPKIVISEIKQCKCIVSSSLHGLIIADAFGIPNKRIVDRETMPTAFYDYKFHDYYSSIDYTEQPIELSGDETIEFFKNNVSLKPQDKIKDLQDNLNEMMLKVTSEFKR